MKISGEVHPVIINFFSFVTNNLRALNIALYRSISRGIGCQYGIGSFGEGENKLNI